LLLNWINQQQEVGGILTPDSEGMRKLYSVYDKKTYTLQLPEGAQGIRIGRFVFDEDVFGIARGILLDSMHTRRQWTIADEIGRLEMDEGKGLEPAIQQVIEHFKQPGHTKLLLVIRDYLLQQAIAHYKLQDAVVLPRTFFGDTTDDDLKPMGLVLCGGKSTRMGRDKAFITYHHKPQYAYMADMLNRVCSSVFISCTEQQFPLLMPAYKGLIDSATFAGAGPMTGLLTAFSAFPGKSWLVVGCDYPYLTSADIEKLVLSRSEQFDTVCYRHPLSGMDEPLTAIYEKTCAHQLTHSYRSGQHSLRHFLAQTRVNRIEPLNVDHLRSVDTPE